MKCTQCGSEEIDFDQARGDAVCVICGTVLQENLMVNEETFQEDGNGRSNLVGQRVRADGRRPFNSLPGYGREATELTLSNARYHLNQLVSQLRLPSDFVEKAIRLFKVAVQHNFHRGRRTINVACACLYSLCRMENKPQMLLDFSDATQTNLYDLGNTYIKFVRQCSILIPLIDPSVYMHRFAAKLEFEEKTHAVSMTALRVLARMQRDWLTHGRRPAGLCGAALITASIMHGFYRTHDEVARVVRIGNVSLRKRVRELHRTPTAALTAAQIDAGGGDDGKQSSLTVDENQEECDPPAFQRLQEKKKILAEKEVTQQNQAPTDTTTSQGNQHTQKNVLGIPGSSNTIDEVEIQKLMESHLSSKEMQELEKEANVEVGIASATAAAAEAAADEKPDKEKANDTEDQSAKGSASPVTEVGNDADCENENDELSDLDEEDTAKYISTEEEFRQKEVIWTQTNKDYLERQALLEKMKRERPEEYKKLRPTRSQKRRRVEVSEAATECHEAELAAPEPRRTSKKLNYAALKSLDDSDPEDAGTSSALTSDGPVPSGSTRVSL